MIAAAEGSGTSGLAVPTKIVRRDVDTILDQVFCKFTVSTGMLQKAMDNQNFSFWLGRRPFLNVEFDGAVLGRDRLFAVSHLLFKGEKNLPYEKLM